MAFLFTGSQSTRPFAPESGTSATENNWRFMVAGQCRGRIISFNFRATLPVGHDRYRDKMSGGSTFWPTTRAPRE
ncbi:hypothetical protein NGUA33_03767 [Salmonella enterica]|nr:hypothetical protein NGUA33_03767 [Salmonella enterica]